MMMFAIFLSIISLPLYLVEKQVVNLIKELCEVY
jgi:hypothetical protein